MERLHDQLASRWIVLLVTASAVVCGCAGANPATPDAPTGAAAAAGVTTSAEPSSPAVSFELQGGAFTLTTPGGDLISGTYTGLASVGQKETSTIDLHVTSGTGAYNGASGELSGNGKGAFTGEGTFSLTLSGRLATDAGSLQVRAAIEGTSTLACTPPGPFTIMLNGSGSSPKLGSLTAALQHQVASTFCPS